MVYFYAIFGMLCWGIAPLFGKLGLYKVNPVTAISIRTILAAVLVVIWQLNAKGFPQFLKVPPLFWIFIAIEAILATLVGDLAYFAALKKGNINEVTFIMSCSPLITMLLSFIFMGEIMKYSHLLGAALITIGLICLGLD